MQALGLTVATNACIMSTTSHLYDAIQAERAAGNKISDEAIAHLSPARFAQINPFGVYNFDTTDIPMRHPLKGVPPRLVEQTIVSSAPLPRRPGYAAPCS